jgi:hypothetical protein
VIVLAWFLAVSSVLTVICGIAWWYKDNWDLFLEFVLFMLAVVAFGAFITGGIWGFTYILGYR